MESDTIIRVEPLPMLAALEYLNAMMAGVHNSGLHWEPGRVTAVVRGVAPVVFVRPPGCEN
jgi:hypothetical protein